LDPGPSAHAEALDVPRIVLFSDPDTLRGERRCAWTSIRPFVTALEARGIAVVLWGNETRSEMERIQIDLHLRHPFISENGGGLFIRHGYFRDRPLAARASQNYHVVDFGRPCHQVADALRDIAHKAGIDIVAFGNMSIQEVAQWCGLSLADARLAKLREYDEPFRIVDSSPAAYNRLCSGLRRLRLRCFTHEAFHHATGVVDKTDSLRVVTALYRDEHASPILTIGLGNAASEIGLLRTVDVPLLVQGGSPDEPRVARKVPNAEVVGAGGPEAWCDAILRLLDRRRRA
jgi:mannosyl-3-phosphoglycerate phosphatase